MNHGHSYIASCKGRPAAAGVAHTLANIFKIGHQDVLLPLVPRMWPAADQLLTGSEAGRSSLVRKLAVKLAQRLALTTLSRKGADLCRFMQMLLQKVYPSAFESYHLQEH